MTIALIYHDLAERDARESVGMTGPVAGRYKLTPADFAAHLDAVRATGRGVGLLGARPWPDVAFTFDDGGASALLAASMLEERGWRGHFYVTTDRVGTPGFLDADGVRDLAARGHVIGSHSHTHPRYMGKLTREELLFEWGHSRELLNEILGSPPQSAAIPGGYLAPVVTETAAATGYSLLLTSEPSSRAVRKGPLTQLGRYTIWDDTPAATAAAYAERSVRARGRLWAEWQLKKTAKRTIPVGYRALQRLRASRS